jgi:hypothetical protein
VAEFSRPSRLLALDVDGTLLNSDEVVTPRTRAALERAQATGWHVVIVTGRPLPIALPVMHDLGLGEYVVAGNGATIAHLPSDAIVFQASMPGAQVAVAIRTARSLVAGLGCAITTPQGFWREPGFGAVAPLSELIGVQVDDATPGVDDAVQAAVLFAPPTDADVLLAHLAPIVPDGLALSASGLLSAVELTPPGLNKASGLARLCDLVGVDRANTVAFGDGDNDCEMLRWVGHGVAMGNAHPAAKAAADEVTASNDDDGIALVLERLLGT